MGFKCQEYGNRWDRKTWVNVLYPRNPTAALLVELSWPLI